MMGRKDAIGVRVMRRTHGHDTCCTVEMRSEATFLAGVLFMLRPKKCGEHVPVVVKALHMQAGNYQIGDRLLTYGQN